MQKLASLTIGALFLLCWLCSRAAQGSLANQAVKHIFFLISLVGQSINVTTYVIPATTFSADMKVPGHGLASASGKFGAMLGVYLLSNIDLSSGLLICCAAALALSAVTWACFTEADDP